MEDNINSGNVNEEKLVKNENERESDVELGRITGKTLEKIKKLEEVPDSKKVSSLQTVFSVWNTMIGSSIVSIPYNVYCTGIIPTVVIGLVYGFICYFTCSIVVKLGGNEEEFANVVYNYFNYAFGKRYAKIGRIFQITFNLMINIGATFIYFLIINQNLYPCLCLFLKIFNCDLDEEDLTPSFSKFSLLYCALIVSVLVFPLTILREMGALVKFNSYGIYFVSVLLIFVIFNGFLTISKDHFHFEYIENIKDNKDRNLFLYGDNPGILAGTLSLGLFCHSVILPLLKNNRHPENNQRDLFYGYLCVTLTYIIIGIMGYIGFSGHQFESEFQDNWFRFYKSDNYFILVLRLLNVVQLISIFPILFFVVRTQFFSTFFKKYLKSLFHIIIFSFILLFLCIVVLYICYDTLGKLIGIVGASTALVLVYSIAPVINMIYYYKRHQSKEEVKKRIEQNISEADDQEQQEKIRSFWGNLLEPVRLKPVKAFFFYLSMMLIILVGIITLILQFVEVNFFDIHIKKNDN